MKTGGTTKPLPGVNRTASFKPGDVIECAHAASPAYRKGDKVTVYENGHGWRCVQGRDGLEDILSMMVSTFRKVE